jgi:hypothetical protein
MAGKLVYLEEGCSWRWKPGPVFVRKPFTVKELSEKIGTLLTEKREQAKTKGASERVSQGVPKGVPGVIIF